MDPWVLPPVGSDPDGLNSRRAQLQRPDRRPAGRAARQALEQLFEQGSDEKRYKLTFTKPTVAV